MRVRFIILGVITLLALPHHAAALNFDSATSAAVETGSGAFVGYSATMVVANIVSAVFGLLGVLFLVLTIYSGLLWMTAGGNTDTVKKAKGILVNAVIGLIVVLSSATISFAVIRYVA